MRDAEGGYLSVRKQTDMARPKSCSTGARPICSLTQGEVLERGEKLPFWGHDLAYISPDRYHRYDMAMKPPVVMDTALIQTTQLETADFPRLIR